ncbi:Hsp70 family protein [Saccharopolyspora sp. NPDC002686]|uniref:Hsp70 family protein n=1 Tax=Saccharopolyspora sp. NPDC002686 TaxID=3154541 RepID=UPI00332FFA72
MIIGIDLGTTFSVLAVRGKVELADGYPPPTYLEELDVTIIPDPYGNDVIPSAVWEDPHDPGKLVVGTEAKDRAADGEAPILAAKRNIGTDVVHRLGGRDYSAREVATIVLQYLKDIAEQALGERVDRAVITHPAFFEGAMMRETAEAARAAGFDFDEEKHLLMEPTAAALAYAGADRRDPLRLLTYDLGGGTFDVTVMERRGGVVTIKAFGGNRLLGGYTFDRRLAQWLYDRMRERGVQITVDDEGTGNLGTWTQLLQIAENTKHKLAGARTDRVPVHIREQLTDDHGRTVTLLDSINRAQYVELIQELLDDTLGGGGAGDGTKGCELVLADAGLTIEQVDEILLVGGSTWGPWVTDTIRRRWGREARLLEPDRIVAAGAALQAGSMPSEISSAACTVQLDVEPRTPQEMITVAGQVRTESAAELNVVLTSENGSRHAAIPDDTGRFFFEEVELRPGTTTNFTLLVGDGSQLPLAEHAFTVEHVAEDADTGITGVFSVLPKPLFIETVQGMEPLAEEGATLPASRTLEFQRINDFDTIEIRLFQEYDPIGVVLIKDVPPEATKGSKVTLTVNISASNKIEGRATVHSRAGAVIREAPVDVSIPRMEIPSLSELRDELAGLEAELDQRMALETDATSRMTLRADGDRYVHKAQRLFAVPVPDRQEIWLLLRALDRVVHPVRHELEPSLAECEGIILGIRELLSAQGSDPNVQAHDQIVNRLEKEARAAYARRDAKRWAQANGGLRDLYLRLRQPSQPRQQETLPTDLQKVMAVMPLDKLRQELRAKEAEKEAEAVDDAEFQRFRSRVNRVRAQIDEIQEAIEQIGDDTQPRTAEARIQLSMLKMKSISDQINRLDRDIDRL